MSIRIFVRAILYIFRRSLKSCGCCMYCFVIIAFKTVAAACPYTGLVAAKGQEGDSMIAIF